MFSSTMILACALPAAFAGVSATVSTTDMLSGKKTVDNVKATYDANIVLAGQKAKLSCTYDMKAKKDFIKDAKLEGALADVKFALTHTLGNGVTGLTLVSKQAGHVLKAVGDSANALTLLSSKGSTSLGSCDIDYEPAFVVKTKLSKLKLSAFQKLGGGLSATGVVTATTTGDLASDYTLGYDTSLGEGRALSATVSPKDQSAEIEVVDTATEQGATWVASMGLAVGVKPSLSLRRSMKF